MFLFRKHTGATGGHVADTAGLYTAVSAFHSRSVNEVIDKGTRSPERTDYPCYTSGVTLAFSSQVIGLEPAKMIADVWLDTQYEGGHHQQRVKVITATE